MTFLFIACNNWSLVQIMMPALRAKASPMMMMIMMMMEIKLPSHMLLSVKAITHGTMKLKYR